MTGPMILSRERQEGVSTEQLSISVFPDQNQRIRTEAAALNVTVSQYIRELILDCWRRQDDDRAA